MIIPGPLCPMPERLPSSPRLARDEHGRPVFTGRHGLKPIYDGSGFACVKCSKTWRWEGKLLAENPALPAEPASAAASSKNTPKEKR